MSKADPTAAQASLFADSTMDVVYEQPLGERIRNFLRLEHLFAVVAAHIDGEREWDSRSALAAMIDVTDLLARADIKAELMKELDRQAAVLKPLVRNPQVDPGRLEDALARLDRVMAKLRAPDFQPGQCLRRDELVGTIRQRIAIPGGTCNFDLPGFHYWLALPRTHRAAQLRHWFGDLAALEEGIALALSIIRASATPTRENARGGFFQLPLDTSVSCHLVRIVLPLTATCYPEISAGKHRFTVRFLEQRDTQQRPVQTPQDVDFVLERCVV